VIAGRAQSIGAGMIAEREHLLPLAEEGFDLASLHFPEINAKRVREGADDFYSAHCRGHFGPGKGLTPAYVEVCIRPSAWPGTNVCYERHKKVLEWSITWSADERNRKKSALAGSTALEQCRAQRTLARQRLRPVLGVAERAGGNRPGREP